MLALVESIKERSCNLHTHTHTHTQHTYSHKGSWRLPQSVSRQWCAVRYVAAFMRYDRAGRAQVHRRDARQSLQPHGHLGRQEDGGRVRWCCRLIDRMASDGRSSTSHRWRIASRSARRGGFTRVRHGIVAEHDAVDRARKGNQSDERSIA